MIQDSKGALPLESPALQSGVGVAFGSRPLPRPTASQRLPESGLGTWRQDLLSAPARACAEPIGVAHEPAPPKPSVSTRPISQPPQRWPVCVPLVIGRWWCSVAVNTSPRASWYNMA